MKKMRSLGFVAAVISIGSAEAVTLRYCAQPSPPAAYLRKPIPPFCASTRSCTQLDVSNYRTEVETYYRRLRQYASEVDQYYNDASEYVRCMAELD